MKPEQECNYTSREWVAEGDKPKLTLKRVVCPKCKRRIMPGLLRTDENGFGDGPDQWYLVVPRHKRKRWWKKKDEDPGS